MMRLEGVLGVEGRDSMINRMSAAEYQRLVVKPARDASLDDDALIEQLRGNTKQQKKNGNWSTKQWVKDAQKHSENKLKPKKKKQRKPRNDEEDQITMQVTDYLEVLKATGRVTAFSHIPNSTFTRSWSVKKRNTAMGVRAGVPDMLIVFPDKVLFLELKRLNGGVLSAYQKQWITALAGTGKVVAEVAAGFDEAKAVIDSCLE